MADPGTQTDFPLFPLELVVLPGELVPLHIFEERYKTMINACLDEGREFGVVWLADDGLHEIGCACRIERVVERHPDGRLNIVVRGTIPLRVIERQSHLPYPAGLIQFLPDSDPQIDPQRLQEAREAYSALVLKATEKAPDTSELAKLDAYGMAATVDFGLGAKQGLLDLRSENARLDLATRLFRAAFKRLDFVDRAQTRAKSNGKVRFG